MVRKSNARKRQKNKRNAETVRKPEARKALQLLKHSKPIREENNQKQKNKKKNP